MGDYKDLKVWQKSKDLAVRIYRITAEGHFEKDYRFRDQIRSASVSVPSNIAEGDELGSNKQSVRHFHIARGSAAEVVTQIIIAGEIKYLSEKDTEEFSSEYEHVGHMLTKLIKARTPNS